MTANVAVAIMTYDACNSCCYCSLAFCYHAGFPDYGGGRTSQYVPYDSAFPSSSSSSSSSAWFKKGDYVGLKNQGIDFTLKNGHFGFLLLRFCATQEPLAT